LGGGGGGDVVVVVVVGVGWYLVMGGWFLVVNVCVSMWYYLL